MRRAAEGVRLLIVGASHQGEVVADLIQQLAKPPDVVGFLDSSEKGGLVGSRVSGIEVLGHVGDLGRFRQMASHLVPAVGACSEREEIAVAARRSGFELATLVHPSAILATNIKLGEGTVVGPGAMIGVGAQIGDAVIVNTGAIVEHHCRIDSYTHVAPGSRLAGNVHVNERAWIGIGATILDDLSIGTDAVVGAGSVVNKSVEAGTTVVGVPAKPLTLPAREGGP